MHGNVGMDRGLVPSGLPHRQSSGESDRTGFGLVSGPPGWFLGRRRGVPALNVFTPARSLASVLVFNSLESTPLDLNASVQLEMLWVEPGTFTMGSPTTEAGRQSDREDEHNVTLTQGFYLGKYEVTQAQYEAVMTGNTDGLNAKPSNWPNNPNRPVEKVSWADAQVFLTRLNAQQSANIPTGWAYVLPTESQWEYACRAGTNTMYSWGK